MPKERVPETGGGQAVRTPAAAPAFVAVPAQGLDPASGPFSMSLGFDPEPLIRSIRKVGLINPPAVVKAGDHRWEIVTGYRRVLCLVHLGWNRIWCRDLSPLGLSALELLEVNLYDNLVTRPFNEAEKAMVLDRLSRLLPGKEVLSRYMGLLGLPPRSVTLETYLRIGRDLEPSLLQEVARGRVSVAAARFLLELDPGLRELFSEFLIELRFNINQQKQLIELISDLALDHGHSIARLIRDPPLREIRAHPRMNRPQKAKAVLRALEKMRFPRLAAAEETFRKRVSELSLPEGVGIQPPPGFESPTCRLWIDFQTGADLKAKLLDLAGKRGLDGLGDPWKRE